MGGFKYPPFSIGVIIWNIKDVGEIHTAKYIFVCALCPNYILPDMRFIYVQREYTDREGNKATELAKAHAYHRVEGSK